MFQIEKDLRELIETANERLLVTWDENLAEGIRILQELVGLLRSVEPVVNRQFKQAVVRMISGGLSPDINGKPHDNFGLGPED